MILFFGVASKSQKSNNFLNSFA